MKKIMAFGMLVLLAGSFSCEQGLTELNTDPKSVENIDGGTLFANATLALMDYMASSNKQVNNFRTYAQHWAEASPYPVLSPSNLKWLNITGNTWNILYTTVIRDLKGVVGQNEDNPVLTDEHLRNQAAMVEVLEIFTWHLLVDLFGDIPYSEAFSEEVTPGYDEDAAVYRDLIARLDKAINNLAGESRMGAYDLIYGGDVVQWRKFANSFKLRLAIRIADVDDNMASRMVDEALADGVFESSADDFSIEYLSVPPHTNPLWEDQVQRGFIDFNAANTLVDIMNELEDPRRPFYFKDQNDGEWVGSMYGCSVWYEGYAHPGNFVMDPTFPHTLLSYTEVQFLLADAAERGYSVEGSPEDFYNIGVRSSILEWGGTQEEVDDYLANAEVGYSSAPGTWKEKIALQKWLALYNRGFEAWTTWRVYEAPTMNLFCMAEMHPLLRFTYPASEYTLNKEQVSAAASAMGGDAIDSRIFWDVN